jgi:hypothetical protein
MVRRYSAFPFLDEQVYPDAAGKSSRNLLLGACFVVMMIQLKSDQEL